MDLVGERYGRLTVLESAEPTIYQVNGKPRPYPNWWCKCDCGGKIIVSQAHLRSGHTQSCGCYNKERIKISNKQRSVLNTYDLSGEYGIGYTSKGEEFWFDLEDYDKIKDYHWHLDSNKYPVTSFYNNEGKRTSKRMHQLIFLTEPGFMVDHISTENKFDNRKSNLRQATYPDNGHNHKTQTNNTSGKTGVSYDKRKNKWIARIWYLKKCIYLGAFDTFKEAVKIRETAEKELFGDFIHKEYITDKEKEN